MSFVSTGNKTVGSDGPAITTPPIVGENNGVSSGAAVASVTDAAEQMAEQAVELLFGELPEPSGLVKAAVAAGISDIAGAAQDVMSSLISGPGVHNVTVSGSAVPPQMLLFASLNGSETLGALFTYVVQLKTPDTLNLGYVSPAANLPLKPMVGKDLCVNIELDGGGKRHISGLVTAARVVGHEGRSINRTTFLWDGMRLAQECRLGRSSSLYIYSDQGSHEPLARVDRAAPGEADEVLYYHTDVNGAPEEMTDGRGNIVWEAGYQVWGNLTHEKETRPVQQNLRFQGQYLDRETGLHYNLYRFYDPDIGKFISGDPISIRGGINLYQYAPNPISWIDPLGLAVDPIAKLEDRGYTGVTRTSGGGLDYSDSNALYNKRPGVNPVVTIEYSGDYLKDFERANTAAKLNQKSTPRGYVWHHLDDYDPVTNKGTMQLIKQGAHQGISHSGGVSQYKAATGKSYTFPARKGGRLCG
ncbi:TPA: RHS repeat-associated core domain-containing protein [Salmonella enterica subsp. enterica serovar Eastbourne]